MKEKYWITQDYTCTTNNTHNRYIKTKLKSVVIFSFSLLLKGTCHETMLWATLIKICKKKQMLELQVQFCAL